MLTPKIAAICLMGLLPVLSAKASTAPIYCTLDDVTATVVHSLENVAPRTKVKVASKSESQARTVQPSNGANIMLFIFADGRVLKLKYTTSACLLEIAD